MSEQTTPADEDSAVRFKWLMCIILFPLLPLLTKTNKAEKYM